MRRRMSLILCLIMGIVLITGCGDDNTVKHRDKKQKQGKQQDSNTEWDISKAYNDILDEAKTSTEVPTEPVVEPGSMWSCFEEVATADWQYAYKEVLDTKREQRTSTVHGGIGGDDGDIYEYALYDIDKDGIPELFIEYGNCEANYMLDVYTYNTESGEALAAMLECPYGHVSLYSDPNGNGFVYWQGHMGDSYMMQGSLENGVVGMERIYEETLDMNDVYAEYTQPDAIVEGSEYIDFCCECSDIAILAYNDLISTADASVTDEEAYFEDWLSNSGEVIPVYTDHFSEAAYGEPVSYDEVLETLPFSAADISNKYYVDMNMDGQEECILLADSGDIIVLSIQDGYVYGYILGDASFYNYIDAEDGILLFEDKYKYNGDTFGEQLVFYKEQAYIVHKYNY